MQRIKELRTKLGLKQTEFAEKINVTEQSIINWEKGKKTPHINTLNTIANTFNARLDWLLTGNGEIFKAEITNRDLQTANFPVPYYSFITLSAGAEIFKEAPDGVYYIYPAMFKLKSTEGIIILFTKGDSMLPYIKDGDGVLIDTNETVLKAETTYAVRWCDTILVKDIQKIADGIKLISRNPAYEPIVLTGNAVNEIQIIGSVLGGFYTK